MQPRGTTDIAAVERMMRDDHRFRMLGRVTANENLDVLRGPWPNSTPAEPDVREVLTDVVSRSVAGEYPELWRIDSAFTGGKINGDVVAVPVCGPEDQRLERLGEPEWHRDLPELIGILFRQSDAMLGIIHDQGDRIRELEARAQS